MNPLTAAEVAALAPLDWIELRAGEAEELLPVISALTQFEELVTRLEGEFALPRPGAREPGYAPSPDENPHNAFIRRCDVEGAASGPLAGLRVGVKDNIALAGVPMTNGSRATPFLPEHDAVVVERILAAGGRIVGTLNMDDFGAAGLGETSAFGPARNPVDTSRSAGGSSGGSGAAVRSGEVDLALAVDQGGSGRIPAAFCGVVAVKATHGLVPSFGIVHIDHTIDVITPLARTVMGAARLLEVIAGPDWRDPQWVRGVIATPDCASAAEKGVRGLRVGIVEESCDPSVCEPSVLEGVERAAEALTVAGASVGRVSIPLWRDGLAIFLPYIAHLAADMYRTEGQGVGHLGALDVEAMRAYARRRREESADLAKQVKCWVIADRYVHEKWQGIPYGRLHNLRLAVRERVSRALGQWDLLITPTVPLTAPVLADSGVPFSEISGRTAERLPYNTAPINLSGHPALSLPSGADLNGMPTAVQLIGAHFDERTVFRAAFSLEHALAAFFPEAEGAAAGGQR
jgi:amidase